MMRRADLRTEYLRGVNVTDNNECADMFKEYSKCLKVA